MKKQTNRLRGSFFPILLAAFISLLFCDPGKAAPSPIGTGTISNITLGVLQDPSVINRKWPSCINYNLDLSTWRYDVYVPPSYDGNTPFGVIVYISSVSPGLVLGPAADAKNLIWIAPRNVQNNAAQADRFGAGLLALYRAKELFNIDPRRVYTSGLSGGARVASALAFMHSEVIHGTAPSSGECVPRLNAVTPDYIPNTSGQTDSYYDYSLGYFTTYYGFKNNDVKSVNASGTANNLRSFLLTRYGDYREDYFVEAFHCAYEPQGQIAFLYDRGGSHQDASVDEIKEAVDYLDRNDIFPVNANITAGANGFASMVNISQLGAQVSGGDLTPTLSAVAAIQTGSSVYWDNANGSTFRWLWEVKNAAPTNQKSCFGVWFTGENWGGGVPVSLTTGTNPGILITVYQTVSGTTPINRMVISARPDSGGETVFYDGYFSFVPAYSTAWTNTKPGYLTGTGAPAEIRMDLNSSRWQLTFNGIALDGTTNSIANGTQISRDNKRSIFGFWDSALSGTAFWKHDPNTSWDNTWSPFTKSIFTVATGAISGTGATPSQLSLRYVIASDPNLPAPLPPGPTGLAATANGGAVNLTWAPLPGATSYVVKRSVFATGPFNVLQSNVTGTSYSDTTASGSLYYYTVSAITGSGSTANATPVLSGLAPLLPYCSSGDIGDTGATGSAFLQNGGRYTILASGSDIWGTADGFQFMYQQVTGDCDIRARVTGVQNTNVWAKAGVMIRNTLDAGSAFADVTVTPSQGIAAQWRSVANGGCSNAGSGGAAPYWVRLVRSGNAITSYCSTDGITWTTMASNTILMNSTIYVGLAVSSHAYGTLCTATFDNFSVVALPSPWSSSDVGTVGSAGSASLTGTTYTVAGSGADIWGTADAFRYVYQAATGDCDITARVSDLTFTNVWGKAGVMIRETLTANSTHAMLVITSSNGIAFQNRTSTAAASNTQAGPMVSVPYWVRLVRAGDVFTGYASPDGVNWTQVGSVTIPMASSVYIGLPVTSHSDGALSVASFDNVLVNP